MQHHVTFQNNSQDHWGGHGRLEIKLAKLWSRTRESADEPAIRPPAAGEVLWAPRIQAAPLPHREVVSSQFNDQRGCPRGVGGTGENIPGRLHRTTSAATTRVDTAY